MIILPGNAEIRQINPISECSHPAIVSAEEWDRCVLVVQALQGWRGRARVGRVELGQVAQRCGVSLRTLRRYRKLLGARNDLSITKLIFFRSPLRKRALGRPEAMGGGQPS